MITLLTTPSHWRVPFKGCLIILLLTLGGSPCVEASGRKPLPRSGVILVEPAESAPSTPVSESTPKPTTPIGSPSALSPRSPSPLGVMALPPRKSTLRPQATHPTEPLKVVIHVPARKLSVLQGDYRIASYPVGVGRPQFPTPAGKFSVIRKIEHPAWENPYLAPGEMRIQPGSDNPLGTRWLGFKATSQGEYGIHGTDTPESVGKLSSHGCVRMRIPDVEQLFGWVEVGTPVEIRYEPAWLDRWGNQLMLTVYPHWFKQQPKLTLQSIQRQIAKQYPTAAVDLASLQRALQKPANKPLLIGQFHDRL